ncbi:type 4a pilus biogenesis protein PilO [bacterium]|nr:type 4a pilus biogenesis protein PilO [bacterium]
MAKINSAWFQDKLNILILVVLVLNVGGVWSFYQYVYIEQIKEIETKTLEVKSAKTRLENIEHQLRNRDYLEMKLSQAKNDLAVLRAMFPSDELVAKRLRDLYRVFRATGIDITKFEPKGRVARDETKLKKDDPKSFYNENLYELELNGGFHMLGQMFAEVANFRYPTMITGLSAKPSPKLKKEIDDFETQGWQPKSMRMKFKFTTFTSRQ